MENPPINKKIKSLHYPHRQTGLSPKGPFMKMGNELYKIINYIFSLRLLCKYFMIRIMKVLLIWFIVNVIHS
jgi:hypothetical protein